MGQFTIHLPNSRQGNVRWGKVIKAGILLRSLPWIKGNIEAKTSYIIKVEPAIEHENEFQLFKTKEGIWSQDADGTIPLEGPTILAIKKAIEEHEKFS